MKRMMRGMEVTRVTDQVCEREEKRREEKRREEKREKIKQADINREKDP